MEDQKHVPSGTAGPMTMSPLYPRLRFYAACAMFKDCIKQNYGDLGIAAADAHAVLAMLECASLGMVTGMLYAVAAPQIACTALQSSFELASNEPNGFAKDLYVRFKILCHYVNMVSRLNVAGPVALEAFAANAAIDNRNGLPCVSGAPFAALAQIGDKESRD